MRYCFVFVCQQGDLEIKSLLLALSLKKYIRCQYELVVAIPQPSELWGSPDKDVLHAFKLLGVRIEYIQNLIGQHYPIGNKLSAIGVETKADKVVFLDSDMLCMRGFEHQKRFEAYDFHAKAADMATYSKDAALWEKIYAMFGMDVPDIKVQATVSKDWMLPYYNAGLVMVANKKRLYKEWISTAQRLDNTDIPNKYPWLDQISLPIAVAKLQLSVDVLAENYNFPLHLKPLDAKRLPYFCHYHNVETIRREPVLNRLLVMLVKENSYLYRRIAEDTHWSVLLEDYCTYGNMIGYRTGVFKPDKWHRRENPSELIITGIPRSGTSYLCKLLNDRNDVVLINEPEAVFSEMNATGLPWGLSTYYRTLRQGILLGHSVENKSKNGQVIQDTAKVATREDYYPEVKSANFLLGTKNTLMYLSRVPHLRQVMPNASIFACIRNPFDTISSWKSSFEHLKNAHVESFSLGGVHDAELSWYRRELLLEIASEKSKVIRRARLWVFLAEGIREDFDDKYILRYEDICNNPQITLRRILEDQCVNAKPLKVQPSSISQKREYLSCEDYNAIQSICSPIAAEFGYEGV